MDTLRVRKLSAAAQLPSRAHATDAGLDLFAVERTVLAPGDAKLVKTGIAIELAPGLEQRRFSGVIQTRGDPASLRHRVAAVLGLTVDANEAGWTVRP